MVITVIFLLWRSRSSCERFILYLVYRCNYNSNDKKEYYKDILSNISMLDFYLERSLKNKYINNKVCEKLSNDLLKITKMIYGWIRNESKCL